MIYPGLNMSNMTDQQIQAKISDLTSKMHRTSNSQLKSQMAGMVSAMQLYLQDSFAKQDFEKNEKEWKTGVVLDTENLEVNKNKLDKLIDIK